MEADAIAANAKSATITLEAMWNSGKLIVSQFLLSLMIRELVAVLDAYLAESTAAERFRRACRWWVSGKAVDGTEQHYLLRVNTRPNQS